MEVIKSNKNNEKIRFNGHMYTKYYETKTNIVWRCYKSSSPKYKGKLKTNLHLTDEKITHVHNHHSSKQEVMVTKCIAVMKEKTATTSNKPMEIFAETVSNLDPKTKAYVPLEDTVKRTLRNQKCKNPNKPGSLGDLRIPDNYSLTSDGRRFLLHDNFETNDIGEFQTKERVIIFGTGEGLTNLSKSDTWMMDDIYLYACLERSSKIMEKALVPLSVNELYITHAEYQGCFIKIWANFYSKKQSNFEKRLQDYNNYTKEFHKLDLCGNSLYVYIYKLDSEIRVYRCQVLSSDLVTKTHSIILIDYGRKMIVSFSDVREVVSSIDPSLLINLSQRATIYTFLLSEYLGKHRSNDELIRILCHKYYKYRRDFEVGGITFVSLYGVDKSIIEKGAASTIEIAAMIIIAKNMASTIALMNKNDVVNSCPIPSKASTLCSILKSQVLDYVTLVDVIVTQVSSDNNTLMLTVQIIDNESEVLKNMLNSIDRQNLKLAPVLEVYTPCLIIYCDKLVRAIILEVQIDKLYVDLVDFGRREFVSRAAVFEIPSNCKLFEVRSLNVVLNKSNNLTIDKNSFIHHYYKMLPLKMDPKFGLYRVKLYKKKNEVLVDVCSSSSANDTNVDPYSMPSKSPDFFSITEINEEVKSIENSNNIEAFNNSLNDQIIKENGNGNVKDRENAYDNLKYHENANENLKDRENAYENLKDQENANENLKDQENANVCLEYQEEVQLNHSYEIENIVNIEQNGNLSTEYNEVDNELINEELENHVIPIMFVEKEILNEQEFVGSLIYYKSPYSFRVRRHDSNFVALMENIKAILDSRKVLIEGELVIDMYVIYQNQSNSVYRAQITDMDSDVKKIKLRLIDEGDEMIHESFDEIALYNFIESDCELPEQLVLECSLSDMWFPVMTVDTAFMLQPFFNQELLYLIKIVKSDVSGINLVQLIKETNIDISNSILESGIGQRLCAAMKTDEIPYEENLLKDQSFLSYVYFYHFKVFIQPEPNTVDELEEEILEFVTSNSNPKLLDVNDLQGTYCLATVNNGQWFRAYVNNVNENTAIVNMFDIGLLVDVPLNQIQSIPNNLMRRPQLCLPCILKTDLDIKITEKKLYCITVESINTNGILCVTIEEPYTSPLFNPIVRGFEKISSVHVDGDWTYLQRSQDTLKAEKLSGTLSNLNRISENKSCILPGDIYAFENHGKYYRCLVKSVGSKMAVVQCIDFGFEKQVEKKKLLSLKDSKLALLPALVIAVETFPMAFNMSKSSMFLVDFIVDNYGCFNVLPNKTSSISTNSKLKEALENGCLVKVTCVNSSDECWVVPDLFFDTLKTISDLLLKMQSKILVPNVKEVGSLCAALHSKTKNWHRALILNEDNESENMLSIDSGERFRALKCTKMVSEIEKIPNCALRCLALSNVDVKTLLNKDVNCKLISYSKPLLEVQLSTEKCTSIEDMSSTKKDLEWKVIVETFISFNEFYVIKTEPSSSLDGLDSKSLVAKKDITKPSLLKTLPNGGNAEKLASHDKVEDCSGKMTYEKLYYRCCLVDNIEDDCIISDPKNLTIISNLMLTYEWIMKTFNDKEPYEVTLTTDGQNCIDMVHKLFVANDSTESEHNELREEEEIVTSIIPVENNLSLPKVETVTLKYVETFRYFYVESNSLSTLYMKRINSELDMCIVELPINDNLIGSIVVTSSNQLNGIWCRAKVENILTDNNSAYCYLLDYGSYEECNTFYKPTDFLCVCPPLVRRCTLYAPMLDGKESEIWFANVNEMFKDISTIGNGEFTMSVIVEGDPCSVSLWLENDKVSDMLFPMFVQLSYVKSLTDFKAIAISCKQKAVVDLLESDNIPMVPVEKPIVGSIYLTELQSKLKRVQFDSFGGTKYVVIDVDDTLDTLSVHKLYEIPEAIHNFPVFTMACSLIFNKEEESLYSLSWFQKLANSKVTFIMCVITESDGKSPNLVRLYLDNKDVLDMIKLST